MTYKKNKMSCSRKKRDDVLDHCIVKALQLMKEDARIVSLVQSPSSRMQELTDIFHCEFPNLECTMSLATSRGGRP